VPATVLFGVLLVSATSAQGVLDLLDGETLYDGGSLLTLGAEIERGGRLFRGGDQVGDPLDTVETSLRTTVGFQFGLRHYLQVGFALPFVSRERATNAGDFDAAGLGDLALFTKARVLRLDGPGFATNFALIGALSVPTGADDRRALGVRLEPELQPGSGSLDPSIGFAVTHEPERWRFNAAVLHTFRLDLDDDGNRLGNEFVAELAVGNRFWLQPYPGPFMRADAIARYYHEDAALVGTQLANSGSERATIGLNWAFRPRPSIDLQINVEYVVWQRVRGTQVGDDWSVDFTSGFRF
jgi:hypothetical protein